MDLTRNQKKQKRNEWMIQNYVSFKSKDPVYLQEFQSLSSKEQLEKARRYALLQMIDKSLTNDNSEATAGIRYLAENPNFSPFETRKTRENAINFHAREMLERRYEGQLGYDSETDTLGDIAKRYDPRQTLANSGKRSILFAESLRYRSSPKNLEIVKLIKEKVPGAKVILA